MTEIARDLAQASVLLDLKRYDEAASLLARIVAAEPQDSRAWCLLAATHLGAGRYKEAAAAASRAITLAPTAVRGPLGTLSGRPGRHPASVPTGGTLRYPSCASLP